jgi:hypothetical protein
MPRQYKHPMFQKRHYEVVAELLHVNRPDDDDDPSARLHWWVILDAFSDTFAADNEQFSRPRFERACTREK